MSVHAKYTGISTGSDWPLGSYKDLTVYLIIICNFFLKKCATMGFTMGGWWPNG